MRIAILYHSDDLTNDYAAYLASILDETAEKKGYVIKDYEHLVRARMSLKEENVLLHIIMPASGGFSLKYWYHKSYQLFSGNTKLIRYFVFTAHVPIHLQSRYW